LLKAGFKVVREPSPVKGGRMKNAFVEDPTGYRFELLHEQKRGPSAQITLKMGDLYKPIAFYIALGIRERSRHESDEGKFTNVMLGYGDVVGRTALSIDE
jgi:lactoylglutathione lyase